MEATSGSTLVPSFSAFSAGLWQVSAGRGYQPRWSHDGKELFYVEGETLTAVEVTTSPAFATVAATPLFSDPHLSVSDSTLVSYNVSADSRFVLVDAAGIEEDNRARST